MEIGTKIRLKSEEELLTYLTGQIEKFDSKSDTIVSAGHFMLVFDKNKKILVPGIVLTSSNESFKQLASMVGSFPQYTWEIGCKIVNYLKKANKNSKLALLINDWQLVPIDTEREASQPNKYRSDFYTNFNSLPRVYEKELHNFNLESKEDVLLNRNGDFFFKENNLRDRFLRKIKRDRKVGDDTIWNMCDLSLDKENNVVLNRKEEEPLPLILKSKVGCSGGVAQMMIDIGLHIKDKNHPKLNFINLMPLSCKTQVNAASELAINFLTSLDTDLEVSIINVFLESRNITKNIDYFKRPAVFAYKFSGRSSNSK